MTLRTFVYVCAAVAAAVPAAGVAEDLPALVVTMDAPQAGTVGVPVAISCVAADPGGISRISLRMTAADGTTTTLGAAFGATELRVEWVPVSAGSHVVRCRARGLSSSDADETVSKELLVAAAAVVRETPVAAPVEAAPGAGSAFPAAPPPVGAVVYQGGARAALSGPRRVAATPDGDVFVVDRAGRLHWVTKRGDLIGTTLEGVVSVAAGSSLVFAGARDGVVVGMGALTGRILTRFETGASEAPVGLAYDDARELLWLAYGSGVVQARRPDGSLVYQIDSTPAGLLVRVTDVAVGPDGLVWVSQDRAEAAGYLHAFSAETGGFVKSIASGAAGQARVIGGISAAWGRIYVADLFSGNVRVLNENGETLEILGRKGTAAGELAQPADVAFLLNGDALVANMDADRLERFGAGRDLPVCEGDADCDHLSDAWELANGMRPDDPSDMLADVDGDGLNAAEEYAFGSDPRSADTDGDGYADDEVLAGYSATDREDHWPVMTVDIPAVVDPGVVRIQGDVNDRGHLGGCGVAWRQLAGPVVSFDATAVSPWFIARSGVYRFEAIATCGGVPSRPAAINVSIRNVPPRVDLPRVVAVDQYGRAKVNAGFASDANGDGLKFSWIQTLGPALIGEEPGAALSVDLGAAGLYAFQATIDDRWGHPATPEVAVVAIGPGGAPSAIAPSPVLARAGEAVVLDASASFRHAGAEFVWEQTAGEPAVMDQAGDALAVVATSPGRYAFRVSVVEGALRSPPAEVEVFVAAADGQLPVARAAAPAVVAVNTPVTLDAYGSSSGAGEDLSYAWRQVRGPAAGLSDADTAVPTVVAFEPGSYAFELVVTEGASVGVPVQVSFEARAGGVAIPVAVATGPASARVGRRVTLSGAGSVGAAYWRWSQVEGPWVNLQGGSSAAFVPPAAGVYGFELEVNDGKVRSAPARVNVVVEN